MRGRASIAIITGVLLLSAGCTSGSDQPSSTRTSATPRPAPETHFAAVRSATWSVTAAEIAGDESATMVGFDDPLQTSATSAGDVVVVAAETKTELTVSGIDASNGDVRWRRPLALSVEYGWSCVSDRDGLRIACMTGYSTPRQELSVIDGRSGRVESSVTIAERKNASTTFAVHGDDVYVAAFTVRGEESPVQVSVDVERRSLSTGKKIWTSRSTFPSDVPGHDGPSGIEVGRGRIVVTCGPWQTLVDPQDGRVLSSSGSRVSVQLLSGGGSLDVTESGEGVRTTLRGPDGKSLATRTSDYAETHEAGDFLIIGSELLVQRDGSTHFAAPGGETILDVAAEGAVVVTASDQDGPDLQSVHVWDVRQDADRGTVSLGDSVSLLGMLGDETGALALVQQFSDDAEQPPARVMVLDLAKPDVVAGIDLGAEAEPGAAASIVRTDLGAAATTRHAVYGFVASRG